MDRSRIILAFALALSILSVILGITGIGISSRKSPYNAAESGSLLVTGRSGVAVLNLSGVIHEGHSSGDSVGADDFIAELKEAEESPQVRAVILSVNSPGGSVGATKRIYTEVLELRKKKPVISVISEIAASGGYYIASASDKIFAFDSSLIGSIGVISFHGNISELLNRYGIKIHVLKAGKYKDASYPFREQTDDEKKMMGEIMDVSYRQFISDVAEGRKKSVKDVEEWAEGRIFSGSRAKTFQMIDNIGGMDEAVQELKLMLKTTDDLPLFYRQKTFMEKLMNSVPGSENKMSEYVLFNSHVFYLYPGGLEILMKTMDHVIK